MGPLPLPPLGSWTCESRPREKQPRVWDADSHAQPDMSMPPPFDDGALLSTLNLMAWWVNDTQCMQAAQVAQ